MRRVASALLAVSWLLVPGPALAAAGPRPGVVSRTIQVLLSTTGDEIMFDQQRLDVPFVKTIRLRYKNAAPPNSAISHNVAIIRPERVAAVIATLQEHDYDLASVRGTGDILALTRVLDPGQEDVIDFHPTAPGDYVYICLMAGHGDMMGMRGVLALKR